MTGLLNGIVINAIAFVGAYLLASLGEMFSQRSGVYNLGVEGIMMVGAFAAFVPAHFITAGPLLYWRELIGIGLAIGSGALLGLLMSFICVSLKAEQGIAGIGLYMLGWGIAGTLFRFYIGGPTSIDGIRPLAIPGLASIPVIGAWLFDQNPLTYLAFLLVPVSWYVLQRTPWGLKVRAVGANPRAAETLGVDVERTRYQCCILGSAMAGLAGAYLSLCQAHMYADNIVAGRGFIAVALVYFGVWKPAGVMGGALLFSLASSLQMSFQVYFSNVFGNKFPYEIAVIVPYVLVIVVMALQRKGKEDETPAALGVPYRREVNG